MASERRQRLLLGALVVVLVAAVAWQLRPAPPAAAQRTASNPAGRGTRGAAGQPAPPDVHIEALSSERPKPGGTERDLFKFKPKAPPPPPPQQAARLPGAQGAPQRPGGPPPVATIPLKFIGYIETPSGKKIASLSDGKSVWTATEGETVLGQYKIWRIGVESIDVSYLDGHGRQTIRMTGQ